MKTLLVLGALLVSVSSLAATSKRVLDCNLSFGPDQAVTVRSTAEGLVLEELTNTGSMIHRPLSVEEFKSRVLKLRIGDPFDSGTLSFKDGEWVYDLGGAVGYADCSTSR